MATGAMATGATATSRCAKQLIVPKAVSTFAGVLVRQSATWWQVERRFLSVSLFFYFFFPFFLFWVEIFLGSEIEMHFFSQLFLGTR